MATIQSTSKDEPPKSDDDKILEQMRDRLELSKEAETEIRKLALEDWQFRAGEQWPADLEQSRATERRPCLTINKIPQFIQQVTNDQRQNRPSIKVSPVDSGADPETAKIIQGLIRHIEYDSGADAAYDTAFDGAATGGFGYFRIITDYVSPLSFDQKILIKRIKNAFSVYYDPYVQEADGSDAMYAFIVEDLSPDEFRARYPKAQISSMPDWASVGDEMPWWIRDGGCRVAEYYCKKLEPAELCQLSDGSVYLKDDLPEDLGGLKVIAKRTTLIPKVYWYLTNGLEIMDSTVWPGTFIPIIPVYGTELDIDGKKVLEGIVRNAKDPQRMYNYWATAETETIALAPKAPFIAAAGQVEAYAKDWNTANVKTHSVLKYDPIAVGGQQVPPPMRNVYEAPTQSITQARMLANEDLKGTTGIHDATLGSQGNEVSGVAIQRRNHQSQTSNFHFMDNLTRSLRHAGRIIVEILPKIYDTERAARIIGDDGDEKVVKLNGPFREENAAEDTLYDMSVGTYDVTIDVGPSYTTKRQEAVAAMLEVTRVYPTLAQIAGDLMVKNMDWPGASEIAARLKKMLPPGILDDGKKQLPPEVQAQVEQMKGLIETLTGELNDAKGQIEGDEVKAQKDLSIRQMEVESKERIEFAKLDSAARIQLAKMDSSESIELLRAEMGAINSRLNKIGIDEPIEAEPVAPMQPQQPIQPDGALGAGPGQPTGGPSPGILME